MAQPFKSPTGIYQLRRKVPPELRPALGHEYKRSLKTRDPSEAKTRFAEEWARSDDAFALARAQSGGVDTLGEKDIQQLAARWFRSEQQKLENAGDFSSWLFEAETWVNEQGNQYQEYTRLVSAKTALNEGHLEEEDFALDVERNVARTLRESGIPMPTDARLHARLVLAFREHWLKLSELALQRYEGNWTTQPDVLHHEPLTVEAKHKASKRHTKLLDLFKTYSADKKLNDGDTRGVRKTLDGYEATLKQFIELCGDLSIEKISRETVREYRTYLAQMPAKGDGIRKLSAKQLIEKAAAEGLPKVSAPTIRNKLRALSAVLSHGVRLGLLAENPVIAGGIGRAAAKAAGSSRGAGSRRRKDYTKEALRRIFASPIYTEAGWSAPRADFGRAWYWMPLLMYYTGARREELAQLAARDVRISSEGIPCLSILAMPDDDDSDRGVKTEGSRRMIPLHPDLVQRGFLDYAQGVPVGGQLFPKLKPSPAGFYGANFGKRWAAYLRDVVGLDTSVSPSHGFRHTFKTLCREVGIPEDVHDAITGHAGVGAVARDYGQMPLVRMAAEIARYPSLDALEEDSQDIRGV
ncbi:DUF6538 domain-containing protein [Variovorax paradoxus]|uniref:DUF6538 domain-containing protein n=1 Tax=Variovorax paradoxus TaxID=34073 RepID=UPI003ED0F6B9